MRADKKRNIAKVAKVALEEPLLTEREIAEKAWVWNGTVNRVKKELEQNGAKDWRIIWITDKDIENIELMQGVLNSKIQDKEEMSQTRIWELAQAMREATARYTLFRGKATDNEGGLKTIIDSVTIL